MRLRLAQLLGMQRAWRAAQIVYRATRDPFFAPERRTFLKQAGTGVVAGMAVLGLGSFGSGSLFEESDGNLRYRELEGSELTTAITEAELYQNAAKLSGYLSGLGHGQDTGNAKAALIEADGRTPILFVSIPYTIANGNTTVDIKYSRHGDDKIIGAGINHFENQQINRADGYEAVDGSAKHVVTSGVGRTDQSSKRLSARPRTFLGLAGGRGMA